MAQKRKEPACSLPQMLATVLTGGLLAFGICMAGLAVGAAFISWGKLGEEAMFRICCISQGIGCLVGGIYTAQTCGSRRLLVALGAAVVCFLLWVTVALLFYGMADVSSAAASFVATVAGGAAAGLLSAGIKGGR